MKSEESQSGGVAGVVGLVIHRTFPFEGQGCGSCVTKSDLFLIYVMSMKRNWSQVPYITRVLYITYFIFQE